MKQQTAGYKDIFDKANNFIRAKISRQEGWYPFFKEFTGYEGCESPVEIRMGSRRILMFGSNNYLGLTAHPKVREAAIEAIRNYGTGCSGSRMLNGTLHLHNELEAELADFMKQEAALLFGTGFQTNHGALSALAAKGDVLLVDKQVHASLVDGVLTSHARSARFRHNNIGHLEQLLKESDPDEGRMVVVDGVYSMEGDTADLPGIVESARAYGARVFLDDAHGIAVLGDSGRGTAEHYDVEVGVDVFSGTFSKSFACAGGFIAGPEPIIEYVKHHSRAFIYSASMPPASLATVRTALEIVRNEPERRDHLLRISGICRSELQRAGFEVYDGFTPVIPVVVDDEMLVCLFTNYLLEEGVYVNPVLVPAASKCLLRITCMAVHTEEHIARLVDAMQRVGRKLGLLRGAA